MISINHYDVGTLLIATIDVQIFAKQSDWSESFVFDSGTTALVLHSNKSMTPAGRMWHKILYTDKHKFGIGWIPGITWWAKL